MGAVTPNARAGEPGAPRYFTDAHGRRWKVVEEPIPSRDWTSADQDTHLSGYPVGWLTFSFRRVRKRLRLFPAYWWALPDAELARLCHRAREFPGQESEQERDPGVGDRSP
jgi:hypothetical protein